jgi:hypothetical protein
MKIISYHQLSQCVRKMPIDKQEQDSIIKEFFNGEFIDITSIVRADILPFYQAFLINKLELLSYKTQFSISREILFYALSKANAYVHLSNLEHRTGIGIVRALGKMIINGIDEEWFEAATAAVEYKIWKAKIYNYNWCEAEYNAWEWVMNKIKDHIHSEEITYVDY